MKVEISKLFPHPMNNKIYGYDDKISELVEKIKSSGWIKPILITTDNVIISGHRRVEVCKILDITEIECEVVEDDPIKQMELLVLENYYRVKTPYQLIRESEIYYEIEKKKSYQRMMSGVTPESGITQGRTTEIVSKKIGMSESTFKKGRKVMEVIDDNPDWMWIFGESLNQSVDGSVKLTEKSPEFIEKVIEKVGGDKDKIFSVIKELEQEELRTKTTLPPGKFGVIIFNLTNRFTLNLLHTDISPICEDDCILFMWVRPHQIDSGLDISKHWNFRYCTCLFWNKDNHNEITLNGEILLMSIKGSPPNVFKMFEGSTEKPLLMEELIKKGYPDWSKVEIFVDDGWKIW